MNKKNVIITIISVLILTCIFAFARTTTTDLGLVKPTWDEEIDILADLNANSDILEAFANDPLEFDTGERLEDRVGAMVTGSTQTGITLTYQDSDNTIDAVIGADDIVETMLKCVNLPADEDIFTYESTTGDFEWHTLAESSIQPLDAGLTSIAGLTTAANKSIYTTALDTYAVYDLTAFARTILDDAAATNVRDTLGLTIGTNVQAYDAALTSISGLTYVSPSFIKLTANDTYAVRTLAETLSDIGAQASDASLTSIAGLTYASPSFIKVTAEDTYAIRTIIETKTDLSLNNVTNDAQIAKSIGTAQGDLIYFTGSATPTVLAKGTATQVLAMNAGATAPEWVAAAGGGYTKLTSFVDQTAWRLFYSNSLGDVVELALGTDGTYLGSNGAAAAPTFKTPSGAGDMLKATYDTDADNDIDVAAGGTEKSAWTLYCIPYLSGTTAFGEIAIGTAGQVLKVAAGATGYEWGTLSYLANVVEDTTPELGGEMDAGAHTIGFTLQSTTGDGTTTIDWKLGNKFKFTFGAQNETFTFTAPTNPCTLMLTLIQDATGSRTITWPATVKWPGGTAPTLTTTANARDKVALDWDGSQYDGVCSKDFK